MNPTDGPLAQAYEGLVCDLDGVVYRGPTAVDRAVDSLGSLRVPVQFATNNASRTPAEVAAHLGRLGLRVEPEDVATSAQAGARLLGEMLDVAGAVLAIGGAGVAAALAEVGLAPVRPADARRGRPVGVLQGYGPDVSAADLGEAAYAVQAGAAWVATNTDRTLPTERGTAPGNGSLVAAVSMACGREPDAVAGKPQPPLYLLCASRLGVPAGRLLAVGDRLDTDIAGARSAGADSLLVLTGVDGLADAALAEPVMRPTFVAPDLRVLREHLSPAQEVETWWVSGTARRRLVDGRWEVAGTGSPAQDLTVTLAAVWQALDARGLPRDAVGSLLDTGAS